MRRLRFPEFAPQLAVAFAAPCALASPALAQTVFVQPATPDADALADEMRLLAANPSDVNAMVRAGELTLKLGDETAAAGFFARAERVDPSNPRIKAGRGMIAVQAGRPGEALRLFADAEALRGDVRRFAADRGLAYDLIGEQERAQRDYRLALKDGPADETLRRYALSLGISGKRDEALSVIEPLLRRSDRGAWRARAFILAMNGDSRGAERIAASMMPGGLGQGLQPFFDRLPNLDPVDRAFAVHFGEVRPTPQRVFDARLAPRLPALQPEPGRPVALAAATVARPPVQEDRKARRAREKLEKQQRGRIQVQVASVQPPVPLPLPPAYQAPSSPDSGYQSPTYQAYTPTPAYRAPTTSPSYQTATNRLPTYTPYRGSATAAASTATTIPPSASRPTGPVQAVQSLQPLRGQPLPAGMLASNRSSSVAPSARMPDSNGAAAPASDVPVRAVPPASSIAQVVTPRPVVVAAGPAPAPVQIPTATIPPATVPAATLPGTSSSAAVATVIPAQPVVTSTTGIPAAVAPQPLPVEVATASSATLPPAPGPAKGEDSILATIIANITVPGSELDVGAAPAAEAAAPATAPAAAPAAADDAQATLIAEQKAADRLANERAIAERKRAADRKLAEAARLAEAAKLAEAAAPVAADGPIVRKRGETVRQFETRKQAAADAADEPVIVRKRGETVRQFDARKQAASAPAEEPTPVRKRGETLRQFETRKLAVSQPPVEDDAPALKQRRGETTRQFEARKLAARKQADDAPTPTLTRKSGETAKQFEARKLAATKKPAADKADAKSGEPARIWVQVSGGANESDLPKEWARVRAKAPIALKGRAGWTTPLRATNRVLTGPFKTDAEARSFVNVLAKEGISAFTFTSDAGQKVAKLATK